jgi:hypothetical protein
LHTLILPIILVNFGKRPLIEVPTVRRTNLNTSKCRTHKSADKRSGLVKAKTSGTETKKNFKEKNKLNPEKEKSFECVRH